MLSFDQVKIVRRRGEVRLQPLWGLNQQQAEALVRDLAVIALEHDQRTRGELLAAMDDVVVDAQQQRALKAAQKMILDQCDFDSRDDVDPPALRFALFTSAALARAAGHDVTADTRAALLHETAQAHGLSVDELDRALFADLDLARTVDATPLHTLSPTDLVTRWTLAEVQAVLTKAVRLTVDLHGSAHSVRRVLHAIKLRQLLFTVEPVDDGTRLVIDGPAALFSQGQRYGQKLALVLPKILSCEKARIEADVVVRKGSAPAVFTYTSRAAVDATDNHSDDLSPLVQTLLDELPALVGGDVKVAADVVHVKGLGTCVPDLVVTTPDGKRAYVEILGFWSREAVWRRVELAEAGLDVAIVWCVSERLRVSEQALTHEHASLLTFKGSLSAKKVAARLSAVIGAS